MDLETENRIASILLKEAAELRRRAEKEGVEAYLRQPNVRGRPNSRFLTATVLGVQQANRAVEVNELWRARQKEKDLDDRLKGKSRSKSSSYDRSYRSNRDSGRTSEKHFDTEADVSLSPCSSRKRVDEGLRDDEVEQFLYSRIKRGRGAVGSRMDETGPYLPSDPDTNRKQSTSLDFDRREGPGKRVVLGPEKPYSFLYSESSEEESSVEQKTMRSGSSKHCSRKHRSKDKSREKEKKKSKEKSRKQRNGKGMDLIGDDDLYLRPKEENIMRSDDDMLSLAFAMIEDHYFVNKGFFKSDSFLLDNVEMIRP